MKQADFIARLAGKMELSKSQGKIVFDAFSETLAEILAEKDNVVINGVGRLYVKDLPPRDFRNPITGDKVSKGARTKIMVKSRIKE